MHSQNILYRQSKLHITIYKFIGIDTITTPDYYLNEIQYFKWLIMIYQSNHVIRITKSLLINALSEVKTNFLSTWAILNLKYYQSLELTRKHLFTYIRLDAFTIIYNRRHNKVIVSGQRKSLYKGKNDKNNVLYNSN